MPAPYSLDLRQKAITALEAGHSKAAVSRLMGIGTTTLTEWHNRYRVSGEVAAQQGYQQGHSHKITDWEAFRAFAATHGDKTQAEMAQLWPEEISEDTIGRALKRIGFTRKSGATPRRSPALGNAHQDKELSLRRKGPRETPSLRQRVSAIRSPSTGLSRRGGHQ